MPAKTARQLHGFWRLVGKRRQAAALQTEADPMAHRREFLRYAAMAAVAAGAPVARAAEALGAEGDPPLPPRALFDADAERYWAALRRQWLPAPDRVNLNCGMLGCSPLPVIRAMVEHLQSSESFREDDLPRFGFEENAYLKKVRTSLAEFVGCSRDELALTRNTTEGNAIVANGLDLKPGDEVILTDQEHHSARGSWEMQAARRGIVLVPVRIPKPPRSAYEIQCLLETQITERGRGAGRRPPRPGRPRCHSPSRSMPRRARCAAAGYGGCARRPRAGIPPGAAGACARG